VRSRLNRASSRLRELVGASEEEQVTATLRPDRVFPVDAGDPGVFKREKERLMSTIGTSTPKQEAWSRTPAMYPRLSYADEVAALEYLTRVFQFTERREARMGGDDDEGMLAWTPSTGTGATRPTISTAITGTSPSRSRRSWRASKRRGNARVSQAYTTRVTHSATRAGFSSPSISTVMFRLISSELPFSSTFEVTARARIREPTLTGLTKRTLLNP
jgi:hypothetical protein